MRKVNVKLASKSRNRGNHGTGLVVNPKNSKESSTLLISTPTNSGNSIRLLKPKSEGIHKGNEKPGEDTLKTQDKQNGRGLIEALQKGNKELKAEIAELQAEIKELKAQSARQHRRLMETNEHLASENRAFREANEELRAEIKTLKA
ncbi:hypothetical protein, partial [Alicyclobacillus kakegawensis]|uniref:hypothetical protein n=1 Tax=Alicyclobacillus kakegawensis TaxID=392012 RepID=UPI000AD989FF